jgi:hypothetical protein
MTEEAVTPLAAAAMAAAAGAARLVRMEPELTVESAELLAVVVAAARMAVTFLLPVLAEPTAVGAAQIVLIPDKVLRGSSRRELTRIMAGSERQAREEAAELNPLPGLTPMAAGAASIMFMAMAFMVLAAAEAAAARRVAGFSMLAEEATVTAAARAAAMAQRRHRGRAALSSSPIFLSHLLFSFLLLNLQMGHISLF